MSHSTGTAINTSRASVTQLGIDGNATRRAMIPATTATGVKSGRAKRRVRAHLDEDLLVVIEGLPGQCHALRELRLQPE